MLSKGFSVKGDLSKGGGSLSGGVSVHGGTSVRETPSPQYGKEWVARILLECFLVW